MGKSKKVNVDLFCINCGGFLEEVDGKNVCSSCGSEFAVEATTNNKVEAVAAEAEVEVSKEVVSEEKPKTVCLANSFKVESLVPSTGIILSPFIF